jgi:hypothetical protein
VTINGSELRLGAIKATRRSFLVGAGLVAATPLLANCDLPGYGPVLQYYGRPGSFGSLGRVSRVSTGQTVGTVPIPSWGFGAGQSAYMSAVTGNGTVVMATTPYTDNQLQPTAANMEVVYLQPSQRRFSRVVVPTTRGDRAVAAPGSPFGGGDIGDVQVVGSGKNEQVMFCSAVPYHGWDLSRFGQLPSLASLRTNSAGQLGLQTYKTANALAAASPRVALATESYSNSFGQPVTNSRGLCEMALLPRSGHVVVSQYFGDSQTQQGALMVIDQSGRVMASWQYPAATYDGWNVKALAREVETDPSSSYGDERFTLICDTFDPKNRVIPFPIQEFSYDARRGTIRPTSTAVRASADGSRMESAKYAPDGTLFVARTRSDGLRADRVAVYRKGALAARAPAGASWNTSHWNVVAQPDQFVNGTDTTGLARSMAMDPKTGSVLIAGLSGQLQALHGNPGSVRVLATVDLGLELLADRNTHAIGVRKASVDVTRRTLWIPIPQTSNNAANAAYPHAPIPQLDQWLCRVDLSRIVGS